MQILVSFHSVHNPARAHPSVPLIHACHAHGNDPFMSNTPILGKRNAEKLKGTGMPHLPPIDHTIRLFGGNDGTGCS
jgi:hypothetical protein